MSVKRNLKKDLFLKDYLISFDIIIKFGFCELFTNSNFNHLIGNSNNGKYLNENVISGNS